MAGDIIRLQALVDKKKIVISEVVIHEILQLDDAEGVVCLPNEEIFAGLAQMGYDKPSTKLTFYKAFFSSQWKFLIHTVLQSLSAKRTSWNKFSTAMASVVICLSKGPSSPPQQPQSSPQALPQGAEFPTQIQQVLNVCSALTKRVEKLENDNAAQKLVIIKLKARVKKLEMANKVKYSKLRRLRKVGASRQVASSDDMEDVFNQGRMIDDMDKDEGIELKFKKCAASATIPATAPTVVAAYTRRRKGVIIKDPEEELSLKTPAETPKVKDKGKGIMVETPKPMKKKDQIELDADYARKLHEEINRDEFNQDIDWDAAMDHTETEARKNMMIYLKNTAGYKMDFFKGMTYAQICPIFQASDVSIKLDITSTSNDSPLVGVNTPRSDEDRLEIMELTVFVLPKTNDVTRLQALVNKRKVVITEATIRDPLRLDDAEGVHCLPNEEIFAELAGRKFNFSKYIFESLVQDVAVDTAAQEADNAVQGDDVHELSIPSPTLPTPPPQTPSTSQVQHTPPPSPHPKSQPQSPAQPQVADFPMSLLQEVLNAYAALTRRVEHLEYDKVAQTLEITKLKRRVKKLEKANKVKGRMIDDLDRDASVSLMDDKEAERKAEEAKVAEVVTAASESVIAASTTIAAAELQVPATTITAVPVRVVAASTRRRKGVVIRDPKDESTTIIPADTNSKDKGKGIMVEEPKPLKKKQHVEMDEEYARKLHEELRYQVMKKRPQTEAQARRNMIMYLKNVAGFRLDYFKGISYDDIRDFASQKEIPTLEIYLKSNVECSKAESG
nr:hypothetical protein [Tanacetum cinerariifolium]